MRHWPFIFIAFLAALLSGCAFGPNAFASNTALRYEPRDHITNLGRHDNGAPGGPGALTTAGQWGQGAALWTGGTDAFSRINAATNSLIPYAAFGHVNGQSALSAWLDDRPVSVTGEGTNAMQWRAAMELAQGPHQLLVAAAHPSGMYTAWATNLFTNSLASETVNDSFDGAGNITNRVWTNPTGGVERTQALSWDARGRLHAVTERDISGSGYNWTATYDGLGRRLSTTSVIVTNGVACTAPTTINSYFDPQVEFLELGVAYGKTTEWKLYGPDINGVYGGANGTGGFEAVSPYLTLFEPVISDVRGNVLAVVTNGAVSWNSARPTGYGAVPGYRPVALGSGASISLSSAWRGRWADITGYHSVGARTYDPVAGRWLSYDPAPNDRDPNGCSAFGGDPINSFDPDGRMSNRDYQNMDSSGGIAANFMANFAGSGYSTEQIGNAFQNYVNYTAYNDPNANGPYQPGTMAYLQAEINFFGWPENNHPLLTQTDDDQQQLPDIYSNGGIIGAAGVFEQAGIFRDKYNAAVLQGEAKSVGYSATRDATRASYNEVGKAPPLARGVAQMYRWEQSLAGVTPSLNNPSGTATAVNRAAMIAKWGGRGVMVGGVGFSIYNIATAQDPYQATVEEGSATIVGFGGAEAGAWAGAGIGSIFPGPGTAIGAVIGTIGGGIFGGAAGHQLGHAAYNSLYGPN